MVQVRIIGHLYSQLTRTRPRSTCRSASAPTNIVFGLASEKDGYANYPGGKEALDDTLAAFASEGLWTLVLATASFGWRARIRHRHAIKQASRRWRGRIGRDDSARTRRRILDLCTGKPTSGDAYVAGFSLAGLFDCKRAEQQVSQQALTETMAGIDSPGGSGVQDSDQALRFNYTAAAERVLLRAEEERRCSARPAPGLSYVSR